MSEVGGEEMSFWKIGGKIGFQANARSNFAPLSDSETTCQVVIACLDRYWDGSDWISVSTLLNMTYISNGFWVIDAPNKMYLKEKEIQCFFSDTGNLAIPGGGIYYLFSDIESAKIVGMG